MPNQTLFVLPNPMKMNTFKPTNKTNPISTKMNDGIVGKQNFFTPAPNASKITTIYNKDRYTQPVQMSKEQVEKH